MVVAVIGVVTSCGHCVRVPLSCATENTYTHTATTTHYHSSRWTSNDGSFAFCVRMLDEQQAEYKSVSHCLCCPVSGLRASDKGFTKVCLRKNSSSPHQCPLHQSGKLVYRQQRGCVDKPHSMLCQLHASSKQVFLVSPEHAIPWFVSIPRSNKLNIQAKRSQ